MYQYVWGTVVGTCSRSNPWMENVAPRNLWRTSNQTKYILDTLMWFSAHRFIFTIQNTIFKSSIFICFKIQSGVVCSSKLLFICLHSSFLKFAGFSNLCSSIFVMNHLHLCLQTNKVIFKSSWKPAGSRAYLDCRYFQLSYPRLPQNLMVLPVFCNFFNNHNNNYLFFVAVITFYLLINHCLQNNPDTQHNRTLSIFIVL